jgi:hypothetical protein
MDRESASISIANVRMRNAGGSVNQKSLRFTFTAQPSEYHHPDDREARRESDLPDKDVDDHRGQPKRHEDDRENARRRIHREQRGEER